MLLYKLPMLIGLVSCVLYAQENQEDIIDLTVDDFRNIDAEIYTTTANFSSTKDLFLNTVNFDLQDLRVNQRGLTSSDAYFSLNGIGLSQLYNRQPLFGVWSGQDVFYQYSQNNLPLEAIHNQSGALVQATSFIVNPSILVQKPKVNFSLSNRNYNVKSAFYLPVQHKKDHWIFSGMYRRGDQLLKEGMQVYMYNLLLGFSTEISKNQQLTILGSTNYQQRESAKAYTNEVFSFQPNIYQSSWGWWNDKVRNANQKHYHLPFGLASYEWEVNPKFKIQQSLFFLKGYQLATQIDYQNVTSPDPTYYKKMPSYELAQDNIDYESVYRIGQQFILNPQLDWRKIVAVNQVLATENRSNAYVLGGNTQEIAKYSYHLNGSYVFDNKTLEVGCNLQKEDNRHYMKLLDNLGGLFWLDLDSFTGNQNNVNNQNGLVEENQLYKYHYKTESSAAKIYGNLNQQWSQFNMQSSLGLLLNQYQRTGYFHNQSYTEGYGKSDMVTCKAFDFFQRIYYVINGRNLFGLNFFYQQNPYATEDVFSNIQVSNQLLKSKLSEENYGFDVSYSYRGNALDAKIVAYGYALRNRTSKSFFYTEGLINPLNEQIGDVMVQQNLVGISQQHMGVECSAKVWVNSNVQMSYVGGIGKCTYANNPIIQLYTLPSDDAENIGFDVYGYRLLGESQLKGRRLGVGPQQFHEIAFNYQSNRFWNFKWATLWYAQQYLAVAPIQFSKVFKTTSDGEYPVQEVLPSVVLMQFTTSKSFRIKEHFLSVYFNVNNLLGNQYKSGGYVSNRLANQDLYAADYQRINPVFATKYYQGNQRSVLLSVSYRF